MASCHVCSRSHSDGWPGDNSVQDGWRGSCRQSGFSDRSIQLKCHQCLYKAFQMQPERLPSSFNLLATSPCRIWSCEAPAQLEALVPLEARHTLPSICKRPAHLFQLLDEILLVATKAAAEQDLLNSHGRELQ
ncbi:hypothetical protein CHARACLAT_011114 [Characodon lateralis]|uniref:Uncharacterized protein n=1 Tax=Characodon lateralis TaxID=208331 RepID=A0ABU7CPP5_9TELE|nr:hypothetical protein [Characodon lateralis]